MMTYTKLLNDLSEVLNEMTDDEAGRLIKAVMNYSATGALPTDLKGGEKYVFITIRQQIDRENAEQEDRRKTLTENGSKGGRPKKTENQEVSGKNLKNQMVFSENLKNQMVFEKTNRFLEKESERENEREKESTKEKEKERERGREKDIDSKMRACVGPYLPPTLDEVRSFCAARNLNVIPEVFFAYYSSTGWKDLGGRPIENWRAACMSWKQRGAATAANQQNPALSYQQHTYSPEDDEKLFMRFGEEESS